MKNTKLILLLTVLVSLPGPARAAQENTKDQAPPKKEVLLDEGFMLDGIVGRVRKLDQVDVWQFIPSDAVVTLDSRWPAMHPMNLLPCSVLEQITGLAGEENDIEVRLWGLFTQYHQKNYLYSIYFLPLQTEVEPETADAQAPPETDTQSQTETADSDEPEQLDPIIPADILAQIKTNKTPDLQKFQQVAVVTGDENLIGRTGYLMQKGQVRYFQPSGFGQNVNRDEYLLLPSSACERAEREMRNSPGRQRFKVSGLMTEYKGRRYILLRRTERTFTNGNFTD